MFIGLVFVVFAIAESVSDAAGQAAIWVMFSIPPAIVVICLPFANYRAFVPKMTPHERWLARKAAEPWPDPTPWKAKHPLDLGPYGVPQGRTRTMPAKRVEPHL